MSELKWSDPEVVEARLRLMDIAYTLLNIEMLGSPSEIVSVNRRVHEPRVSQQLKDTLAECYG